VLVQVDIRVTAVYLSKKFIFRVDILKKTGIHINIKDNNITFANKYTFTINLVLKEVVFLEHTIF
jgi:hypothetical protein